MEIARRHLLRTVGALSAVTAAGRLLDPAIADGQSFSPVPGDSTAGTLASRLAASIRSHNVLGARRICGAVVVVLCAGERGMCVYARSRSSTPSDVPPHGGVGRDARQHRTPRDDVPQAAGDGARAVDEAPGLRCRVPSLSTCGAHTRAAVPRLSADGTPPPEFDGAPLITALREQLGLRLKATTGPVPVIVIDSVERPTPD